MSDEFKIETGIPVDYAKRQSTTRFPFAKLKVGDSFFVKSPTYVGQSAYSYCKYHNIKLLSRTVKEGGVDGVRVWRTE